jgi:DHA1 family tetracycline resistance protein-like MFS transporter
LGRLISGVCGASYTVATAYLADISDDSNRAKNFGLLGAGFGIGFILGPAMGGMVSSYGPQYPFLLAAGFNLINFLFGFFALPESLPQNLRRNFILKDLNPFVSLRVLTTMPAISLLVLAHLFLQMAGQTHPSIWAIYTETRYGWTAAQVGLSLTAVGVLSGLAQGVFTGPLVRLLGERRVGLWGALGEAVGFISYGLAPSGFFIYVVLFASSIFWAAHPALQSLIARAIPPDRQGELQGALMSLTSLTAVANPLLMSHIFAVTSVSGSDFYLPGLVYFVAGAFGLVAFAAVWRWESTHHTLKQ